MSNRNIDCFQEVNDTRRRHVDTLKSEILSDLLRVRLRLVWIKNANANLVKSREAPYFDPVKLIKIHEILEELISIL